MYIIARILLTSLALLLAANLIPGIAVGSLYIAIVSAVILGVLNLIIRPILIVLTLPINILTLGLFTFVINAFLFWFAASFIDGFVVNGFWPALLGSLFVSVVSAIGNKFLD